MNGERMNKAQRRVTVIDLMGGQEDWAKIVAADNFLAVFDRLPDQMRLIVDLKMTGQTNEEIAKVLNISVHTVIEHLRRARKRFVRDFEDF
jgi:DNA-directed RNA polymerase specialized sigma24 family protein